MREITQTILVLIITLGFFFFFLFVPIRLIPVNLNYDNVCKYNYGENYVYESDIDFGNYCIELVHENLTKINPKQFNWNRADLKEMCDVPNFFDLTKWSLDKCKGEFANENSLEKTMENSEDSRK